MKTVERDFTKLNGLDVSDFLSVCLEDAEERMKRVESRMAFVRGEISAFREMLPSFTPSDVVLNEEACKDLALLFYKQTNEACQNDRIYDYGLLGRSNAAVCLFNFLEMSEAERFKNPMWKVVLKRRFLEMCKEMQAKVQKENCNG